MPLGYVAVWIGLSLVLMGVRHVESYGWPPSASTEQAIGILASGLAGGVFWGWTFWKFWLYKKFPAS